MALALSACIGGSQGRSGPSSGGGGYRAVSDTPVKIGKPYKVRGVTYAPRTNPRYDRLGYASWYGSESGSTTANGERFRPHGISAAHTTLPLPTYAEVTSLDTGKTILVRINDRGPFATGRGLIIDLSRGAADQLGVRRQGIAAVRVRVVQPPERDRQRLREGRPAAERSRVPARELQRLKAKLDRAGLR
ncbi:MAG: septal ring lytic transglycosylase RlpA family protein [Novosphingobium sp.]|nr:septal ring lytic transglycosylase RlpA family protein [Novosphingobium sp.]